MSKRKWTPGPWSVDGEFGVKSDAPHGYVANAGFGPDTKDGDREARANVHLIAAAPDLYEALAELITDAEVAINIPASAYAAMRRALGQA